MIVEFLLRCEMSFGGSEHIIKLGQSKFIEILFGFSHDIV